MGIPGVAAIQRAAENRERILARITAEREARRVAKIHRLEMRELRRRASEGLARC
jgi:hypothetical protein